LLFGNIVRMRLSPAVVECARPRLSADCRIRDPLRPKSICVNSAGRSNSRVRADGALIDTPREGAMPKRMIVFVPAILAIVVAAVASTSRSSRAADDCIAKPSSAAPSGSRWYYQTDRASRRQCWFLAPEGAKARRAAAPKRPLAARPMPPQLAETPTETAAAETPVVERQLATASSAHWLEPSISAGSIGRESPTGNSYADEDSATYPQDEMPLVWPVLTSAELAAAERQPESAVKSGPTLAYLTGALALAIMFGCAVFERFAARRLGRREGRGRSGSAADTIGPRKPVPPAFAGTVAAAGRPAGVRKSMAAMRHASVAHAPRTPGDPDCDIEESLRRLLHDWQRLAA